MRRSERDALCGADAGAEVEGQSITPGSLDPSTIMNLALRIKETTGTLCPSTLLP